MMDKTGIRPVEYKALVLPDKVEDKSAGGMYLPEGVVTRQQYAQDRGVLVAHGEGFFKELPGPVPKIGDRVTFSKYAGSLMQVEKNGQRHEYRLLNDKDICAILEE
jgi:co-chaperonin GroES (HSP10)